MKKRIFPAILLAVACMLSACGGTAEPAAADVTTTGAATTRAATTTAATTTAATEAAAETTTEEVTEAKGEDASLELTYQAYTDIEMIEILEFTSWDGLSPGQIETNDAIYENVISRVENFETNYDEANGNGIEVFAYSFTDESYVQIYNTILEYPTYGTAGDLFGFVYDIENDDYITLDEFLASYEVTEDEMSDVLMELYLEANPENTVDAVTLKTFKLTKDADGEYYPSILFEMEVTGPEASEPYKGFYIYSDIDSEVWEMNSECLFDPYDVDEYDEPLHCHEGWYEFYFGDSGYDFSGDPEENTLDILWDRLGDLTTDKMLVSTGEEEINGETCQTYALGTDTPEKFTADIHFAVTPNYEIYYMDVLEGPDWIPFD
jgi:predicted small secreted protein